MSVQSLPEEVERMVQRDFDFSLKNRLHIAPEIRMYKPGEDVGIWTQRRNDAWEYQVYFDGEFICFLSINDSKNAAYYKVMKNLLEAYKSKKIHFNLRLYAEDSERRKEYEKNNKPQNPIKSPKTSEEKMLHEVFERASKPKKDRKKSIILNTDVKI